MSATASTKRAREGCDDDDDEPVAQTREDGPLKSLGVLPDYNTGSPDQTNVGPNVPANLGIDPRLQEYEAIQDGEKAQEAQVRDQQDIMSGKLVVNLFCDGSLADLPQYTQNALPSPGGCGVVYREPLINEGYRSKSYCGHFYSVAHTEMCAVAESLDIAIALIDEHKPESSEVLVFTDSTSVIKAIDQAGEEPEYYTWQYAHLRPIVRAIVWQSHYLSERGCKVYLNWLPRCSTFLSWLADEAARRWIVYSDFQSRAQEESIANTLHAEIEEIAAEYERDPPNSNRARWYRNHTAKRSKRNRKHKNRNKNLQGEL
ncbi:hypothetical protein B0H63DRAFT_456289 [Podospora didyma]|uniref:RNase H type-1 domain-containing protein n=1 Tax=Podospora didyma TaxID=330526 RepID=A0AAE0JYG7_9PEZI|nr:hypothetical protein B0H63DRAFT_456289 [Podospora didyma]